MRAVCARGLLGPVLSELPALEADHSRTADLCACLTPSRLAQVVAPFHFCSGGVRFESRPLTDYLD
jgi:hypothetical protein